MQEGIFSSKEEADTPYGVVRRALDLFLHDASDEALALVKSLKERSLEGTLQGENTDS